MKRLLIVLLMLVPLVTASLVLACLIMFVLAGYIVELPTSADASVVTATASPVEPPCQSEAAKKIDLPLEIKIDVPEVPAKIRNPSPPIVKKAAPKTAK